MLLLSRTDKIINFAVVFKICMQSNCVVERIYNIHEENLYIEKLDNIYKYNNPGQLSDTNGYKINELEAVYQSLKFMNSYFNNSGTSSKYLHSLVKDKSKNHLDAQNTFLLGYRNNAGNKLSAMLVDGMWWENEAKEFFNALGAQDASRGFGQREYRIMLLPDFEGQKSDKSVIAAGDAGKALLDAGVDAIKVGIGPGSICTTRVVAGVGMPQVSAIYEVRKAIGDEVPLIADGGIKQSGDVAKALAVGAHCVMMGSVLAGTMEGPGDKIIHHGRRYVVYRGMGSLEAMKTSKGSRERYGQSDVDDTKKLVPQGIEGMVPYRGALWEVIHQFTGGLRYSLGYCGTRTIPELTARAKIIRVSAAGLKEAHPHDILLSKDAPNYMADN